MNIYDMHGIQALQLQQSLTRQEVESFVRVWFEWRTYGLVLKNTNGDEEVNFGDWIVSFPDGTYAPVQNKHWDHYIMTLGQSNVRS
jgi:hypothetical protein